MEGSIAKLTGEIEALKAGIKALHKAVSEATAQRKAENTEYKDLIMSSSNYFCLAILKSKLSDGIFEESTLCAPSQELLIKSLRETAETAGKAVTDI